jgi:HAD superfamily hydrolase (TIGR01549 family)
MLRAVVFDVGETLVDESRLWKAWARWLGVSESDFFRTLEDVIRRGEHHRRVFERFRPGLELARAREERHAAGDPDEFRASDLYPDAAPCLSALRARGLKLGIAGNQPESAEAMLREAGLPVDFVASSEKWGVEKPSPEFFARIVRELALPAADIAYVGDRLDNDVLPAADAGMCAVFLARGPWGKVHAERAEAARAAVRIVSLSELPEALNPGR